LLREGPYQPGEGNNRPTWEMCPKGKNRARERRERKDQKKKNFNRVTLVGARRAVGTVMGVTGRVLKKIRRWRGGRRVRKGSSSSKTKPTLGKNPERHFLIS